LRIPHAEATRRRIVGDIIRTVDSDHRGGGWHGLAQGADAQRRHAAVKLGLLADEVETLGGRSWVDTSSGVASPTVERER